MVDLEYRVWQFDPERRALQKIAADGWADHTDYPIYLADFDKVAYDRPLAVPRIIRGKMLRLLQAEHLSIVMVAAFR